MPQWEMSRYTSLSDDIIQTQIPGMIEGWARTFTVRTRISENTAQTGVFKHESPGIYNPHSDIYLRAEAPVRAIIQHYKIIQRIIDTFGIHPTEAFERHCRIYDTDNYP